MLLLALEGLLDFFIRLGIDCEPNAFHFQFSLVKFYRIAYQSVGLKHGLIGVKSLGTELLKALKVLELQLHSLYAEEDVAETGALWLRAGLQKLFCLGARRLIRLDNLLHEVVLGHL